MSKLLARIAGYFSDKTSVGVDKAGNRYFTRTDERKKWVIFKGEDEPTTIPVEWICWLNGQRKRAPTPEEMPAMEARRELVKENVAILKKEEEERRNKGSSSYKAKSSGKVGGPDLKSFMQQFPTTLEGGKLAEESDGMVRKGQVEIEKAEGEPLPLLVSSEPTGSGATYKPGTWQPPT